MYLLDTNILLETLLEQQRADDCEKLLNQIEKSDEQFYVSSFTVHSVEINLTRENKLEELTEFLSDLISSKITRLDTTTEDELEVLKLINEFNLDFDDAIQLFLCQKHNLKIVSYDAHFDDTSVERLEPADLLD